MLGTFIGAMLLSYTSPSILLPLLSLILLISASKVWRHT
jgi:uncharacterized membrane protein YfcA